MKSFFLFISVLFPLSNVLAAIIITPSTNTDTISASEMLLDKPSSGINTPSNVTDYFAFATDILLVVFPLIAIGVFLWVAYNLFTAQGNEEQFKKAWKTLVYVGVGIIIAMASYVLVKIVTNISL